MKTRKQILDEILADGIVAIVRLNNGKNLLKVAKALHKGGLRVMEFTMNTPDALPGLRECSRELPDVLFGAGTVLNSKAAGQAIESGAQFIVAPNTNPKVMEATHAMGKVSIPGAYTPTEVGLAMDRYADLVKLFPAKGLGPDYVKELMGPFSDLRIMPTGGVTTRNAANYFQAGACAVAVGGSMINNKVVDEGNFKLLTTRAKAMRKAVDAVRKELSIDE